MVKLLKLDPITEPEVIVIGISSHVHDHRLCWSLNRTLGLELSRRRKDLVEKVGPRQAHHAVFEHIASGDEGEERLYVVNNHSTEGPLIKDPKHAHYFLVVDKSLHDRMPELLERVRRTEFVLAAFPLDHDQLRGGHKLLL